jgi:riboflavin kinase/FMN adenylyltransferase
VKLFRKLDDFPEAFKGGALTIGNFDGVHRGHSRIIERLKYHADVCAGSAIVFTFDPHPVRLLRPEKTPPPLTWTNRKADLLSELGVDAIVAFPTDEQFLSLSDREFFDQIVVDAIGAKAIVEGPNFFFGRNREGNVSRLQQFCNDAGITMEIVDPIKSDGGYISSSRIRELICNGSVGPASQLLTRPYRIRGMVTHGAARGAKIGFPTANLDAVDTLIPANGVYAGRVYLDGRSHLSAINIGPNPTFGDRARKVEVHILDFENSIYGRPIEVDFIKRLRDIRQFDSPEQLKQQLMDDIADARRVARG